MAGPMATLADLAGDVTSLSPAEATHLQRLVASWGLVADLCFADLVLYARVDAGRNGGAVGGERAADRLVVLAHVRPTTSQTMYSTDLVGLEVEAASQSLVQRALRSGEIVEGSSHRPELGEAVEVMAIPVRVAGHVVAVMSRESAPSVARRTGQLERAYLEVFGRLARMVSLGEFPFPDQEPSEDLPRVGDGVILLDEAVAAVYVSPNAISALHRLGVVADLTGRSLAGVGVDDAVIRQATTTRLPATAELTVGRTAAVLVHCVPLLERRRVLGALVLVRDVSELRRLDRLLVTKDTHIREIHHRVKNNLQTISSLLRLQARRVSAPEARQAIEESVRRIGSIALVHETLSREAADDLPFADIARPIVRMAEESLVDPERPVRFEMRGDLPVLPSEVATPLALVLTELLQNTVDHAEPSGDHAGVKVTVEMADDANSLVVLVCDDGVGLSESFSLAAASGLGLSIVRTLVESELGGQFALQRRCDGMPGTEARVTIPHTWD
jgi:two-component sensor histidine kinase